MKTVFQALIDEVVYPIGIGKVENIVIKRFGSEGEGERQYTAAVADSTEYKGALADCLYSLLQAVSFSEADKSVSALTDSQRKTILGMANRLYNEIGEDEKDDPLKPKVYINC